MTGMAVDPPLEGFLNTVRRSRLFDPADLDRLAARLRPASARQFADGLVRSGELTHYQADKLLNGRWQGLVIGPYSILAPLGRGGMGTIVYLAHDRRMAEALGDSVLVALKLLPHRKAEADPKVLARFRREMVFGYRVKHPNVVRTFAAGDLDSVHYLALEYVPGKTIRQLVNESGPLEVGDAARIFADVAAGLAHIHAAGLVHRDVKPANVIVRPDGRAVLVDLGLAFAPKEPLPDDPAIAGGKGYVLGTMDYLAPEQARDATGVGPAADLYGLGCALYFALTGAPPFPAEGTKRKIHRHRHDPPPLIPHGPPEFAQLVSALMAKEPAGRPKSAAKVSDRLRAWAKPARPRPGTDAVAAVDAPGLDADLWEVTPGEELAGADRSPDEKPFEELEESAAGKRAARPDPSAGALVGWLLVAGLVGLMGLILLVAVLRRL
ncbi:serine/threonine-protein kinase [Frigoriglobus tundricola]|uniref:Protein kinase domain-containing protein n=1 Tax=Frigoriglobus tundricola TaxID=2774151 RepID=A0A6M5Z026_9BACT|nr:serine/threonine-protein kinase [Frigoriglobus tundricola]QJW99659.1 hypothetical protein FTUN_7278 [Frigoriglobus tundricola]